MHTDYEFVYLDSVGSTQDEVRERLGSSPVAVAASRQTRGRGRRGSQWDNADAALALSVGFATTWPLELRPVMTLTAGVVVAEALLSYRVVGLKWPNDLVDESGLKLGGILTESDDGFGSKVIVGIGLNLAWNGAPPAGWSAVGGSWNAGAKQELCHAIVRGLLDGLRTPGSWPRERYRQLCFTLGTDIRWEPDGAGRAVDVAHDGGLVVATRDGQITLRSGAVWSVSSATLPTPRAGSHRDRS